MKDFVDACDFISTRLYLIIDPSSNAMLCIEFLTCVRIVERIALRQIPFLYQRPYILFVLGYRLSFSPLLDSSFDLGPRYSVSDKPEDHTQLSNIAIALLVIEE